jgi:hypothetical protein
MFSVRVLGSFICKNAFGVLAFLILAPIAFAQSPLADHPTPVTTNEVNGIIKPRDLGDARLTTHYYWFDGGQGDVFINLNSKNFAGDVDVFVQNGLKSLTKIVVYADFGEVETGRVVYLRKPERILLRVQGRTPNDETASYRLKFAGSFIAAVPNEKEVEMPTVAGNVGGPVRVNSAGTILPPPPKSVETKAESEVPAATASDEQTREVPKSDVEKKEANVSAAENEVKKDDAKPEVIVEDLVKKAETKTTSKAKRPPRSDSARKTTTRKAQSPAADNSTASEAKTEEATRPAPEKAKPEAKVDPLANVQLVIVFKDGSRLERPLPEVFRFSVDRGVLTVISKDGRVGKYQMVDVSKVTIE